MARSVIGALRVTLGLDSAQFETGLRQAKGSLNRFGRDAGSLSSSAGKLTGAFRALGAAAGGITFAGAAVAAAKYADTANKLTAQLRLATAQSGSFAQAQEDVRRIAADTRSGLEETTDLYASFSRSAGELGINQEQVARITQTVNSAFKVSGASAAESAGSIRQLSQAFASGVLRGDEFNSIMEGAPRLARLLADSLGVPVGKLREMAEAGELTADKLVKAFSDKKFTAGLDAEFREMPVTFDQAMSQINNAALVTFGAFDRGGEFSAMLSSFFLDGARGFADLEKAAADAGTDIRSTFAGLADAFNPLLEGAKAIFGEIGSEAGSLADKIRPLLGEIDAISGWIGKQGLGGRLLTGGSVGDWWDERPTRGTTLLRDFNAGQSASERALRGRQGERGFRDTLGGYDIMGNRVSGPARSTPSSKKTGGSKGPSAETLRKRAEQEAERAADALRRFTDDLAREQTDLKEAMARLSGSTDAMATAQVQKVEDDRAIREREINDRERITDAQRQELINLNNQNANAQKALIRKEQMDRDREQADRIAMDQLALETELLQLSSNLAKTAQERRDIELRIVDIAFEEERLRLEGIKATAAVNSAEWAYAEARLKKLDELKQGSVSQARQQTQGPLEAYLESLPRTAEQAREALERVQVDGLEGLSDGLADVITGARSLGEVFKGVANQIIADLARIVIQRAIIGPLANALFGGSGQAGGGGLLDSVLKLPGFATGGSFKVGGSSSVGDKNLVAFRANAGEMVDVRRPGNDNGGRGGTINNYYGPGAEEFWGAVDSRASAHSSTAVAGYHRTQVKSGQRRLGNR